MEDGGHFISRRNMNIINTVVCVCVCDDDGVVYIYLLMIIR